MAFKPVNSEALKTELEEYFKLQELMTAPAWRPTEGETLIGIVVGKRMATGGEYDSYPVIVFQKEDGSSVAVHAFHQLLREAYREIGLNDGMLVATTYHGVQITNDTKDKAEKDQTKYHMYFAADLKNLSAPKETTFEL